MNVTNQLAGFYKIVARKLDGSERVLADWFPNTIHNGGLDRLGQGAIITGALLGNVWTSSLQSSTGGVNSTFKPYYGWQRYVYRFAVGTVGGSFSAVSVGWAADQLFSTAGIADADGNLTTVDVLTDEYVDVYYELRIYPPATDSVKVMTMNGVNYTVTVRPANIQNSLLWRPGLLNTSAMSFETTSPYGFSAYTVPIGSELSSPLGTPDSDCISAISQNTYVLGSHKRTAKFTMPYGQMTGGVRSIYFRLNETSGLYCGGAYQVQFDPFLPKPDNWDIHFTLEFSWARRDS